MVLLLNFAYIIITLLAIAGAVYFRKSKKKLLVIGIVWALMMAVFVVATPAMPTNAPSKFEPVIFEPAPESVQIRDSLRKPEFTPEEQRQRAPELFDWKTRVPSRDADKPNSDLKQVESEKGE